MEKLVRSKSSLDILDNFLMVLWKLEVIGSPDEENLDILDFANWFKEHGHEID